jgi:GNAT superfamily N-acetyltransferase
MRKLDLSNGYYQLPQGKLANVATFLDMKALPQRDLAPFPQTLQLVKVDPAGLATYRTWFRKVGEDLMWFSRLIMPDAELSAILAHPDVHSFALMQGEDFCGLLELDFRPAPECELAFFGLVPEKLARGLGRARMDEALRRAFAKPITRLPITRLFVHTCTFDHPAALPFYIRSGFTPVSVSVEIHDDPRLTGKIARNACPQAPLIT